MQSMTILCHYLHWVIIWLRISFHFSSFRNKNASASISSKCARSTFRFCRGKNSTEAIQLLNNGNEYDYLNCTVLTTIRIYVPYRRSVQINKTVSKQFRLNNFAGIAFKLNGVILKVVIVSFCVKNADNDNDGVWKAVFGRQYLYLHNFQRIFFGF